MVHTSPTSPTYSPVPELNLLKEFEDNCEEPYAQWGWLDDFGEMSFLGEDPELRDGLLRFASANGSGSLYALWRRDDRADLATLPVVLLGDEGGLHVVARDLREFLRLLGALEAGLACDWENVYERDEEELPGQADYLAWLERNFGLAPPEEAWDIILEAQDELEKEWTRWIHPLLPDAVFSSVAELNLLKRFEDGVTERYAGGTTLHAPEDEAGGADGTADLLVFASANDDGDAFALWRRDDRADLATLPVVVVGDEGDFHVVARNVLDFLQFLGALCGLEVYVGGGGDGDESDDSDDHNLPGPRLRACEPSPGHAQYLAWLNERFALAPAQDAAAAIRAAQADVAR
ncbi:hypothetical protein HUT18_15965 [Streptomyces sp. NA04227]|uniref:hypothetical protein n=1 Tax=Streptomyces sp. NA04227 TaxID=2742136 RepID=UPI001591B0B9|nr:hypothetical protein [Streptomyces sp. NA04227]QKW07652.1 hypothetical protein HUT18_15965 [Streptomyces sp. NA04227]